MAACAAQVDAQVRAVLGRVLAQRRSAEVAFAYVAALSPGTRANCWALAEAAGHEGQGRMQALVGSYVWDWGDLRAELAGLAGAWLPDREGDLIGPGIAIDETADLKDGGATACVAPQHAGCTGKVENCVTTVFSAYVTATGQSWADFDVYMPERWAGDMPRRRAAGIPDDLGFATKPELAIGQLGRLTAAGLPVRWAAFDEVYGRSGKLRHACRQAGLAYVAILPCDYQVTTAAGTVLQARDAVADAVFERRSCGMGSKGPRISDWALAATADLREFLLIRRLISRPEQLTFYLCYAPQGRPATMTYFITIAGRRWPVEETFKTGKDMLGWDQSQIRSFEGTCRHTALRGQPCIDLPGRRRPSTRKSGRPRSSTSAGPPTSSSATPSATSPTTPATPAPGPPGSTTTSSTAAKTTPTPSASSPCARRLVRTGARWRGRRLRPWPHAGRRRRRAALRGGSGCPRRRRPRRC